MSSTTSCGGCKNSDKLLVYLKSKDASHAALMEAVGFTDVQTRMAIDFTKSLGECLIFEGSKDECIALIEKLVRHNIVCEVRPKALVK